MRIILGLAATGVFFCAVPANAASAPGHTDPGWLKSPTPEDLRGLWPAEAWKQQLGGRVVLECEVDLQGLVQDCSVKSEDPPGMGFGNAALSLAPKFLFRPATESGRPVTSRVNIPVGFTMEGGRSSAREPQRPPIGSHIPHSAIYDESIGPSYFLTAHVPWAKAPSEAQLAAAWPVQAKPDTAFGHVVLACQFNKSGDLSGCLSDAETPKGQGFGQAARSLAPLFHMDPAVVSGGDLRRLKVNVAIHFTAPNHREDRRLIDHPDWLTTVSPGAEVFPAEAAKAGLTTGRAVLDCLGDSAGELTACQVVSEEPAGMGFGASALKTATAVSINPWTTTGEPADGAHVVFAIRINNKEEPEDAAKGP